MEQKPTIGPAFLTNHENLKIVQRGAIGAALALSSARAYNMINEKNAGLLIKIRLRVLPASNAPRISN
jgi:hypothetical protein